MLEGVTAEIALTKPWWSAHTIWQLVAHLAAELKYAADLIAGTAGPWVEGLATWPAIAETTGLAWQEAVQDLRETNRELSVRCGGLMLRSWISAQMVCQRSSR
jgi:hypothetical protein